MLYPPELRGHATIIIKASTFCHEAIVASFISSSKTTRPMSLFRRSKTSSSDGSTRAIVTGSVAVGALITSLIVRKLRKDARGGGDEAGPALEAHVGEREIMEGRYRFYEHSGSGTPIVLLHSINAAGSSYEMKPIFDALVAETQRPVYALEWFGFGLSDRPPVTYTPALFQRQLRRFLSEHVKEPADVIAYSLGAEFAVLTAESHPFLFRSLVLIVPTGLDADDSYGALRSGLVRAAEKSGIFELAFSRLARPETLERFYREQIFAEGSPVPPDLVDYATRTTRARGAANAAAAFIAGDLFSPADVLRAYKQVSVPMTIIAPSRGPSDISSFERLGDLERSAHTSITVYRPESGFMPQFEAPDVVRQIVDSVTTVQP